MIAVDVAMQLRDFGLDMSFEVGTGQCMALVGPTGCGKTTTLRIIAGLEVPDRGVVRIDEETVVDSERGVWARPEERRVGVVFQDYALFPHMSVLQNVMYGARARRMNRAQAEELARSALEQVRLVDVSGFRATDLSGGQQQRVAIARAIASGARAFLMDEPMSALDTSTRRQVRGELRQMISELGIQTVVVTHDVVDALTLGDTLCVMRQGRVVQQGDRRELLARPKAEFVAEFLGVNLLAGKARRYSDGLCEISCCGATFYSTDEAEGEALLTCDPRDVSLSLSPPEGSALNVLRGRVTTIAHLGGTTRVTVENGASLTAEITHVSEERLDLIPGKEVYAHFKASSARVYK